MRLRLVFVPQLNCAACERYEGTAGSMYGRSVHTRNNHASAAPAQRFLRVYSIQRPLHAFSNKPTHNLEQA